MGNSSKKDRKNNEKSMEKPGDSTQKNRFRAETNLEPNLNEKFSMEQFWKNIAIAKDENLLKIDIKDWKYDMQNSLWVKCEICGERFDGRYPKQPTDCGHGNTHSFCGQCLAKLSFSESGYQCPMCYGS